MDVLAPPPAEIPPHPLHDPVFVRALNDRDFTTVFALAHRAGLSWYRIGAACSVRPERVAKIARGEAAVTALDTIERIADGLRIPGAFWAWLRAPGSTPPTSLPETDDGDDPMNRRQPLRGALAAGLTGTALTQLAYTRRSLDTALAADTDPAGLSDLEAAAGPTATATTDSPRPASWPISSPTSLVCGPVSTARAPSLPPAAGHHTHAGMPHRRADGRHDSHRAARRGVPEGYPRLVRHRGGGRPGVRRPAAARVGAGQGGDAVAQPRRPAGGSRRRPRLRPVPPARASPPGPRVRRHVHGPAGRRRADGHLAHPLRAEAPRPPLPRAHRARRLQVGA